MSRSDLPNIIVIGGVGTALNVCEQIVDARERFGYPVNNVSIVIDTREKGEKISGFTVVGKTNDIQELVKDIGNKFIFCLHKQDRLSERYDLALSYGIPEDSYTSFIHPLSFIAKSAIIGYSSVVLSNSTIQSGVTLGNFNIINSNVTIEHETTLGNGNFISANCCIGAGVRIDNFCFLGLNSSVRENTTIGDNVYSGMNSLIINDYTGAKIKGQPAKPY